MGFTVRDEKGYLHKAEKIENPDLNIMFEIIVYNKIINENWCTYYGRKCKYTCRNGLACNFEERTGGSYMDCKHYSIKMI